MPCKKCGSDKLVAKVKIPWEARYVERHGTVSVGGVKISQLDIKNAWDSNPDGTPKTVKGPIRCKDCGAEHVYLADPQDDGENLRLGSYRLKVRAK